MAVGKTDVMVAADTIADLATAVLAGAPKRPEALAVAAPIAGEGVAAPPSARSLVEALVWQAERNPDRTHLLLREDAGEERTIIAYGELWSRAEAVATGLRQWKLRLGETVSLMLRTEEAFFASFFGVLLAGGVPVPIYPPFRLDRLEEYAHRQGSSCAPASARYAYAGRSSWKASAPWSCARTTRATSIPSCCWRRCRPACVSSPCASYSRHRSSGPSSERPGI